VLDEHHSERAADQPFVYQIRIKGHLSPPLQAWFEGLAVTLEEDGNTLLTGSVVDQAALHGILKKIRDLGMALLFVYAVDRSPQQTKQMAHE
jgi:hypothetical protein